MCERKMVEKSSSKNLRTLRKFNSLVVQSVAASREVPSGRRNLQMQTKKQCPVSDTASGVRIGQSQTPFDLEERIRSALAIKRDHLSTSEDAAFQLVADEFEVIFEWSVAGVCKDQL